MTIYEVVVFDGYEKLGSWSDFVAHRVGLFRFRQDAIDAGERALRQYVSGSAFDLLKQSYHYESYVDRVDLVFRSNIDGYEERRYSYRIEEVELL